MKLEMVMTSSVISTRPGGMCSVSNNHL
eukprot:SAG31_NODE_13235_length_883_cov_1.243622_1_plen_27_part_10